MSGRLGKSIVYLVGWTGFGYMLLQLVPNGGSANSKEVAKYRKLVQSDEMKKKFLEESK